MPIINTSSYQPSRWFLKNSHLNSIYPVLFRKVSGIIYERTRISTSDGDFLDIDGHYRGSDKLAILSHGFEGSSKAKYILGMVKSLHNRGIDALAWNHRGCSGQLNSKPYFYKFGFLEDLQSVINHALEKDQYKEIYLIGFSIGGTETLKYIGKNYNKLNPKIKKSVIISSPCKLDAVIQNTERIDNFFYKYMLMHSYLSKLKKKTKLRPNDFFFQTPKVMNNWKEFDKNYLSSLFGYQTPEEHWKQANASPYLQQINIPTLLINARDDSLIQHKSTYPLEEAQNSKNLFLELPKYGGHIGFVSFNSQNEYWSETRSLDFITQP